MAFIRTLYIVFCLLIIPLSGLFSQTSSDDFIPLAGIEAGLGTPVRLAIDQYDNIYISDVLQKCIKKYDMNGNLIATLVQDASPVSVAINPEGVLFYGDEETGFIYKLGSAGLPELFYSGTEYPSSMVFSPDNILYVADNQLKRVLAIDVSGDLIGTIGEGMLLFPTGLAFDTKNDHILVAEHGGLGENVSGSGWFSKGPLVKVYIFDRQGNEISSFGTFGNTDGKFYRLQGMCIGRCGNIYLCEPFQGNINVYTEDGIFITKFGEYGTGTGQLNLPIDIAFDSQERIIVSCYNKGSLELFTINDPLPSANILTPDVAVCTGLQADISIALTGTPPWSITFVHDGADPVTIDNITNSPFTLALTQPGDFYLTSVSDANATGSCISGMAHISFHPEPTATIRGRDYTICENSYAVIPIYFTGDSPWTFTYTHDGNDPVTLSTTHNPYLLEVNEAGLYEVTAISGRNCEGSIVSGSLTVSVRTLPSATFTAGNDRIGKCAYDPAINLSIAFTGIPPWTFTYTVDDENLTLIQTFANPYTLAATEPGTYEVKIVDDNFCSSTDTYGYPEIVINPEPTAAITLAELGLCPNSVNYFPIHFTGTAPWTFSMQRNGAPAVSVTTSENPYMYAVDKVGTYNVISLEDGHCIGNPLGVSIVVRRAQPPTATVPSEDIILCEGQTAEIPITFKGTAPWTFTYLHNGINPITLSSAVATYLLTVNAAGTYELTAVTDANCDARKLPDPVTVVQYPVPVAAFSYIANELQVTFINESSNAFQYEWQFGDNNSSTLMNPMHTYQAAGDYMVTLKAFSEFCGYKSFSETITVASLKDLGANGGQGSDPGGYNDLDLRLYPNPTTGFFTLELKGVRSDEVYMKIISMTGQTMLASKYNVSGNLNLAGVFTKQLDISAFANGIYKVELRCGENIVSRLVAVSGE